MFNFNFFILDLLFDFFDFGTPMFININLYFKTFGCNINNFESEKILKIFFYYKIILIKNIIKSNIMILNSCIIRKNPQIKILKELKNWFFLKKYKIIIIILTGCLTEYEEINKIKFFKIDIIFNLISDLFIIKIFNFFLKNKKKIFFIKKNKNVFFKKKINNYISIMKGCNHNCSYCIIPNIKGKEFYFDYKYIFNNILNNIKKQYELTLLGQNVNSYKFKLINFNSLLYNISKIKNIKRINFFSSNIFDFDENFFFLYKNINKISQHFHLPIQSGSNFILKKMNRKYNIKKYLFFLKKIKKIKNTSISTDIIISFPGEKFKNFDLTLKLINKSKFLDIYYFLYSKRKNTISFNFKEEIKLLKKYKLFLFKNLIKKKNINFFLYSRTLVIGYISKNIFIGKMDNLKLVFFEHYNYNIIGKFIKIKIINNKKNFYLGIYVNSNKNF